MSVGEKMNPLPSRQNAQVVVPNAVLGVMGGGQLGAMFAVAAKRMGYRVEAISDSADCPCAHHCNRVHVVEYSDQERLIEIAKSLDVLTFEFENIPVHATRAMQDFVPIRPAPDVLYITQDRVREKAFLVKNGFPCAPHQVVRSYSELEAAVKQLGIPCVLKTAAFGYDGKGQQKIQSHEDLQHAWESLGSQECVLEGWIDFECEVSVVVARGLDGQSVVFAPSRNAHVDHILDVSSVPSGLSESMCKEAERVASEILEKLEVVGVACVEFFVTQSGNILVNEIAPRPHNSGHLTINACETSQFEQQVRAICGLPLGSTKQLTAAAMANILGECWQRGEPRWSSALRVSGVSLHLYGKHQPRKGRKMGHLTATASTADQAIQNVMRSRGLANG